MAQIRVSACLHFQDRKVRCAQLEALRIGEFQDMSPSLPADGTTYSSFFSAASRISLFLRGSYLGFRDKEPDKKHLSNTQSAVHPKGKTVMRLLHEPLVSINHRRGLCDNIVCQPNAHSGNCHRPEQTEEWRAKLLQTEAKID